MSETSHIFVEYNFVTVKIVLIYSKILQLTKMSKHEFEKLLGGFPP